MQIILNIDFNQLRALNSVLRVRAALYDELTECIKSKTPTPAHLTQTENIMFIRDLFGLPCTRDDSAIEIAPTPEQATTASEAPTEQPSTTPPAA